MPKLNASSPAEFSVWKNQAKAYFQANALTFFVLLDPVTSLQRAFNNDYGNRPAETVRSIWHSTQGRIFGILRSAVEGKLGTAFFDKLEVEGGYLDLSNYEIRSTNWVKHFKWGNANYLWKELERQYMTFHPHDLVVMIQKYNNIKYKVGEDPVVFKNKFDAMVREMEVAGLVVPNVLHMATWYQAIPEQFSSLKQSLNAYPHLTHDKIYAALLRQVQSERGTKPFKPQSEQAAAAIESNNSSKSRGNGKGKARTRGGKSNNGSSNFSSRPSKYHCDYCNKDGHDADHCNALRDAKKYVAEDIGKMKLREHSACFIEEGENEFVLLTVDEVCNAAVDHEADKPVYFLFDSGSTSHVVNDNKLLYDSYIVPETNISTAIRGKNATITKRGRVLLNDRWELSNVAYVHNASTNLISEGRLADAGYTILKTKDFIKIIDRNQKAVLVGVRVNRLWVYRLGGETIPTRPRQELKKMNSKHSPSSSSSTLSPSSSSTSTTAEAEDSSKSSSSSSSSSSTNGNGREVRKSRRISSQN